MKKFFEYIAIMLLSICVIGCSDDGGKTLKKQEIKLSRAEQDVVAGQSIFAWNLLDATLTYNAENAKTDEVVLSPLGFEMALNMTAYGIDDASLQDLMKVLDVNDLNTLSSTSKTLLEKLPAADPRGASISMAFANWQNSTYKFNPGFASSIQDLFAVPTYGVNFGKEDMQVKVNKWGADKTSGVVDNVLNFRPDNSLVMLLCNALYFNGKWSNPFDKALTSDHPFHDKDCNPIGEVKMMTYSNEMSADYVYTQFAKYKVRSFGFGDGVFMLNVYIPEPGYTLNQAISSIIENKKSPDTNFKKYSTHKVKIPKFEVQTNDYNAEILATMGFDLNAADYSKISDALKSIRILQASKFKIDEEGAEAASVTVQLGDPTSPAPEIIPPAGDFIADRPFIYTITGPYGAVLFIGTKTRP